MRKVIGPLMVPVVRLLASQCRGRTRGTEVIPDGSGGHYPRISPMNADTDTPPANYSSKMMPHLPHGERLDCDVDE
jgi:hypothetical protein